MRREGRVGESERVEIQSREERKEDWRGVTPTVVTPHCRGGLEMIEVRVVKEDERWIAEWCEARARRRRPRLPLSFPPVARADWAQSSETTGACPLTHCPLQSTPPLLDWDCFNADLTTPHHHPLSLFSFLRSTPSLSLHLTSPQHFPFFRHHSFSGLLLRSYAQAVASSICAPSLPPSLFLSPLPHPPLHYVSLPPLLYHRLSTSSSLDIGVLHWAFIGTPTGPTVTKPPLPSSPDSIVPIPLPTTLPAPLSPCRYMLFLCRCTSQGDVFPSLSRPAGARVGTAGS